MKHIRWLRIEVLVVVALSLAACAQAIPKTGSAKPVTLKKIEGSAFSQVILTDKAAERIGLQTEPIKTAVVKHMQTVPGEVVSPLAAKANYALAPGKALVRSFVNQSDLPYLDGGQSARIQLLDDENGEGLPGERIDDLEDQDAIGDQVYFAVNNQDNALEQGQRVFVELPLQGNGTQQKTVPYTAVIYGLKGETWVYVNTAPLVYVRQPVEIDFIDEDSAVLKAGQGPAAGTPVVTVGVEELYGAETGVSK